MWSLCWLYSKSRKKYQQIHDSLMDFCWLSTGEGQVAVAVVLVFLLNPKWFALVYLKYEYTVTGTVYGCFRK